jgi:hypothetical protein
MSQIISVKLPQGLEKAWGDLTRQLELKIPDGEMTAIHNECILTLKKTSDEIECEGRISDAIFEKLTELAGKYDGKILYEGEMLNSSAPTKTSAPMKLLIALIMIVFLPITIIVLLFRFLWAVFQIRQIINNDSSPKLDPTR